MEEVRAELYKIVSHGMDGEQYFPGASTVFTGFDHVVTGTGDTEAEAYNDAVDQLAWAHDDDTVVLLQLPKFWGDDDHDVCEGCESNGDVAGCEEECESHYYVSVHFNIEQGGLA
jgi:hypothetical protein